MFYLDTFLCHPFTPLQKNAAGKTICPKMPKLKDQNIFASFPAWCQQQNMQDLQIGFSIFKPLSKPGDIVILLDSTGHPEGMVNFFSSYKNSLNMTFHIWEEAQLWSCALTHYTEKETLNKWQIIIPTGLELRGTGMEGTVRSIQRLAPVLRWPTKPPTWYWVWWSSSEELL